MIMIEHPLFLLKTLHGTKQDFADGITAVIFGWRFHPWAIHKETAEKKTRIQLPETTKQKIFTEQSWFQRCVCFSHPKTNMETKHGDLEDFYPFLMGDCQVPC